jgi:hypothetical protein
MPGLRLLCSPPLATERRFKPNEPNKPIKLNKPNEHQETAISFESPQRLIKQIAWPDPGFLLRFENMDGSISSIKGGKCDILKPKKIVRFWKKGDKRRIFQCIL